MLLFLKNRKNSKSTLFIAKLLGIFGQEIPNNTVIFNVLLFKKLYEEAFLNKMNFLDFDEKIGIELEVFQKIMRKLISSVYHLKK